MRAVWSLGRPRRGTGGSASSSLNSLSVDSLRDSIVSEGLPEGMTDTGELERGGLSGAEGAGPAPPASGEGGGANWTVLRLRRVDLRGARRGRGAGGERTGVQARLSLLGGGLRRADRRGADPAAALLVDARGWM